MLYSYGFEGILLWKKWFKLIVYCIFFEMEMIVIYIREVFFIVWNKILYYYYYIIE